MTTDSPFQDGPYLSAAFFCEKVLEEKDGVKTLVRVIDRIIVTATGPDPPKEMHPVNYPTTLFLRFKAGSRGRGSFTLKLRVIKPSGETPAPVQRTLYFEGEDDRGIDLIVNIMMGLDLVGLYWIEILLDDIRVTKVPLRVIYLPQVTQTLPPPGQYPPPPQLRLGP